MPVIGAKTAEPGSRSATGRPAEGKGASAGGREGVGGSGKRHQHPGGNRPANHAARRSGR